jgi:hypothetical protein
MQSIVVKGHLPQHQPQPYSPSPNKCGAVTCSTVLSTTESPTVAGTGTPVAVSRVTMRRLTFPRGAYHDLSHVMLTVMDRAGWTKISLTSKESQSHEQSHTHSYHSHSCQQAMWAMHPMVAPKASPSYSSPSHPEAMTLNISLWISPIGEQQVEVGERALAGAVTQHAGSWHADC